jgi:hypothetical protein
MSANAEDYEWRELERLRQSTTNQDISLTRWILFGNVGALAILFNSVLGGNVELGDGVRGIAGAFLSGAAFAYCSLLAAGAYRHRLLRFKLEAMRNGTLYVTPDSVMRWQMISADFFELLAGLSLLVGVSAPVWGSVRVVLNH